MNDERRFYEETGSDLRRSAPAAVRNREPIADVLSEWLPEQGIVLEIASGTGQHVAHFAERFPRLDWQPTDSHPDALASIAAWREQAARPNLLQPIETDASAAQWPVERADAILNINMVHISPWSAAQGLLAGAQRLLASGAPLILYGPWLSERIETAQSNLAFDSDLRARDPEWGLRKVEDFEAEARRKDLELIEQREMPANNLMLLFRKQAGASGL